MAKRDLTDDKKPVSQSVSSFLAKVARAPQVKSGGEPGRLLFALDATMSREPTWDRACQIQGEMFHETAAIGGLEVQMAYFRGFGEFRASAWVASADKLLQSMSAVTCRGGFTQIAKVLRHALSETRKKKINAVVFVGDSVEEDVDQLCHLAGQLGLNGVPAFMFHEGHDPLTAKTFKEIARLSGGAYCPFSSSSARELRELLSAVAVFAAGGRKALENFSKKKGANILRIAHQVK